MTLIFFLLFVVVIGAAAWALAGRWNPQGLPDGRPDASADVDPTSVARFDVVLRGYRMEQVDAELERLRGLLSQAEAAAGKPAEAPDPLTPDWHPGGR